MAREVRLYVCMGEGEEESLDGERLRIVELQY